VACLVAGCRDASYSARPHSVAATRDLIATFGWEQFDHPPDSPDLAPSDFHLFLHLKTFLGGLRFHNDNVVKEVLNTWFASQAASFYVQGHKNWCPAMTSASTVVETMSKSSVRYIHQVPHRNLLSG
jgi:hypothetical protein